MDLTFDRLTPPRRILVVEDDEALRELLSQALRRWGYHVVAAATGREALAPLKSQLFDVALLDIRMPDMDGMELLREIRRHDFGVDVVMMTGYPAVSTAVEALKLGAYDYLTKPLILKELRHLIERVMERRVLQREVRTLRTRLRAHRPPGELVGTSPQMERVMELVTKVAATDSPVLIQGESGTGKELAAEAIHRLSARSLGPFMRVNCCAIPADLLESAFFGHVRGAFSGAVADAPGLFRSAHRGTLFLDEIAELPPALQVKLVRVIEDKEVRPVGSTKTFPVDVRIIAATNRRLEETVRNGSLREDLFYRLDVVRIAMPPLREHKADLPALVVYFIRQLNERFGRDVKEVTPEAMSALMAYEFPGNVRELANLLERAYAFGVRGRITLGDLPALFQRPRAVPGSAGQVPTLAQVQRELILWALRFHDNNKERAARAPGLSLRTLYRRLKEYGSYGFS
ncbi:MAG: sigma-54-dependent transcriptional regulator [Candidatus Methylomirabilia bacterium]